jgi:hypothetical protein
MDLVLWQFELWQRHWGYEIWISMFCTHSLGGESPVTDAECFHRDLLQREQQQRMDLLAYSSNLSDTFRTVLCSDFDHTSGSCWPFVQLCFASQAPFEHHSPALQRSWQF